MRSTTLLVAAIVIAAMFVMPATADVTTPVNVKYLHTSLPPGPVTDPIGAELHELYPDYCNWYKLTSWYDNNDDEVLDFCDVIDITNEETGEVTYWHVEEVTITLYITPTSTDATMSVDGGMYLDFIMPAVMVDASTQGLPGDPNGTRWHEIYPVFCRNYTLTNWEDNGNDILDYCDNITLVDDAGNEKRWHVEEVATDIVVRTMCLGECYSTPDCTDDPIGVMLCWQCLGGGPNCVNPQGASWKNLPCPMCPCDCKIRCWEYCPECCDGINNDPNNDCGVDCDGGLTGVRDDECQCCTDLSEFVKDPCGQNTAEPCIPEAATIALVGVGILGIIGIGLRRRDL